MLGDCFSVTVDRSYTPIGIKKNRGFCLKKQVEGRSNRRVSGRNHEPQNQEDNDHRR